MRAPLLGIGLETMAEKGITEEYGPEGMEKDYRNSPDFVCRRGEP
jgi:hypothetical protein